MLFRARSSNQINKKLIERDDQVRLELLRTELIENKSVEKKCREIGRNYQYVATSIISTLLEQS